MLSEQSGQNISFYTTPGCRREKLKKEGEQYLWTYEFGDRSKPVLVMLHGFGGGSLLFFRIMEFLKPNFHVYMLDVSGQGRSSRPNFDCRNYEECEKFYVESIEKWRQKKGIKEFHLLGHSFGGFLSSKYAMHYPNNVKKLMLFSPWCSESTTKAQAEAFEKQVSKMGFTNRWRYALYK